MHGAVLRAAHEYLAVGAERSGETSGRPRVTAHAEIRRLDAMYAHGTLRCRCEISARPVPRERSDCRGVRLELVNELACGIPQTHDFSSGRGEKLSIRLP